MRFTRAPQSRRSPRQRPALLGHARQDPVWPSPSARGAAETRHDSVAAMGETVRDQSATVVRARRDLVVLLAAVGYPDGGDE